MEHTLEINKRETPIVVAFTSNYFIPAATCLLSVLSHSAVTERYHVICLLTEPLPQDLILKLQHIDDKQRLSFSFLNLKDKLQDVYVDERYTIAASYRLLLPELLPEYDKVIYTDCDMIIRNNLTKLYYGIDLGENYLGVVYESPLEFQKAYVESLGCEFGKYFNSGFLLMNLRKMREEHLSEKLINALKVAYLQFPDQDVLNVVCKDKVLALPPYYNSIRTFFLPQYKPQFLKHYTEQQWQQVQKHGNIHYTGAKPWNAHTVEFDVWWRYYKLLPSAVRKGFAVNRYLLLLSHLYELPLAKCAINLLRTLYRKLK